MGWHDLCHVHPVNQMLRLSKLPLTRINVRRFHPRNAY